MGTKGTSLIRKDGDWVDPETGEIHSGLPMLVPRRGSERNWMMAFQKSFESIAKDKEITLEARRVLDFIYSRLDFENYFRVSQVEISKELEMKQSSVSRSIKTLLSKEIIFIDAKEGRSKCYRLNTSYGWKGREKTLKKRRVEEPG